MSGGALDQGATFVSVQVEGGQVVLVRSNGTKAVAPNVLVGKGTAVAGPGGTAIINTPTVEE